jgi:hypothetical protein
MGKKTKTEKLKQFKSVDERIKIKDEIILKLKEVHLISVDENGLEYSVFNGVSELLKILNEYTKPNILSGFSGIIKVDEFQRNIEYILPLRQNSEHMVRLVQQSK